MYELLFIILYVWLFCQLILRTKWFSVDGIPRQTICSIFIIKVVAGVLYGILYSLHYWGGDTYVYFFHANIIYSTFGEYPWYYLQNAVGIHALPPSDTVFTYPEWQYYWRDLGVYNMVHINAIWRIFSFGYYNIHVVFMAFISLVAGLNMFKVLKAVGGLSDLPLLLGVFMVPSVLFWTSGLHKDGFIYLGLSLIMLGSWRFFNEERLKGISWMAIGCLVTWAFRPYVLLMVLPPFVALCYNLWHKQKSVLIYVGAYLSALMVVVIGGALTQNYDIWTMFQRKQAAFAAEWGGSDFWQPQWESFGQALAYLPLTLINVLLRPFPHECRYFLEYVASFEAQAVLGLVFFSMYYRKPTQWHTIHQFMFSYTLAHLLLIGFLVSNAGTLARYRAIDMGFLVILLLWQIDWDRVLQSWPLLRKFNYFVTNR